MSEHEHAIPGETARRPMAVEFVRLARPTQWVKSVFVLVGPAYGYVDMDRPLGQVAADALIAAAAFALLSSALYVVNDILDAPLDRAHPRKRTRPVASGSVSKRAAWVYALVLALAAAGCLALLPGEVRGLTALVLGLYGANVALYSVAIKNIPVLDVIGLSLGFVLRVIGGCAAVAIWPSMWLLNCTFFIAMFLAFGKRLGERASLGEEAARTRPVHGAYTADLLRMAVVVTAVAALVTYASYVQASGPESTDGAGESRWVGVLWLTILPATYGLLRCIVLLDRGAYDDPTELASRDRPFQGALVAFGALTLLALWLSQAM